MLILRHHSKQIENRLLPDRLSLEEKAAELQ